MGTSKLGRSIQRTFSRVKHRSLSRLGVVGGQHCSACDRGVSGFTFFSYRPCHCPLCRSTPRERFVNYAIKEGLVPEIASQARILHVAPGESSLVQLFQSKGAYVAGDIEPELYRDLGVVPLDLTDMSFDEPFDVIYASHVLEHIVEDRIAMQNMLVSLKPGGFALVLVPLRGAVTEEGGPELSREERTRRFGRYDHVRQYGMDIVDRFEAVGFDVEVADAAEVAPEVIARHGFETHGYQGDPETDRIFICSKPRSDQGGVRPTNR